MRRPPREGVYGFCCWMHLVKECVWLKMSLYWGNRVCIYFVDLLEVNLVSRMAMIAGGAMGLLIRDCMFGKVVLREDAFQVMICVAGAECDVDCRGG